jgi:hypothetical protein
MEFVNKYSPKNDVEIHILPDGIIINELKKMCIEDEDENSDNIEYTFIPDKINIKNTIKIKKLLSNDVYEKFRVQTNITGELICCNDKTKLEKNKNIIVNESYEDYLKIIESHNFSKEQWIYNIIDGLEETESIIFQDDDFLVIPTYTWDNKTLSKLHILAIVKNKNLRCLRDLTGDDIWLLEKIKDIVPQLIQSKYGVSNELINMYIHYAPSTYQLHIHFTNVNNKDVRNSVESSHHLSNVIFNLSLNSDYYKIIILPKRI